MTTFKAEDEQLNTNEQACLLNVESPKKKILAILKKNKNEKSLQGLHQTSDEL